MNAETPAPLANFALTLGLTCAFLVTLFALNRITWYGVVQPLSWVFFGDRRRTLWFHLVLLPGTLLHEFSHLLACWVLLVPVAEFQPFSLDPRRPPGWVVHRQTDPIRRSLIALAPFLGCSLALLLLSRFAFPAFYAAEWFQGLNGPTPGGLLPMFSQVATLTWNLLTRANYLDWQTWLFLYLVFSIGLQISPSTTDFQALPAGLILAAGALGGCYLLSVVFQVDWAALPAVADGLGLLAGLLARLRG